VSREVIGSGSADRAVDAGVEALDLDRLADPWEAADGRSRGSRLRAGAAVLALTVVAAGGVLQARGQQARDVAATKVAVSVQGARPVGQLLTFTDPDGSHAVMTVAVAVVSQGSAPLRVVDAQLVGPTRAVPMRFPAMLAPGRASDLEAANLDPCPAPLGLTSVRLTVRPATGPAGTLTLPVPGGLDALSENCPQPGLLPLQGTLTAARTGTDGQVVATVELTNTGPRTVRVHTADLLAGSAVPGAVVEPAAPFDVPAGVPSGAVATEVRITVPPPPCARGMFSTYNDASSPASLTLGYEDSARPAADGAAVALVVDLGEPWKAARRAAMIRVCEG
jgi:hypothetical protein